MKRASAPDAYTQLSTRPGQPQHNHSLLRSTAWGLLAGFGGSLCCLGPSAAVLLGLGSSSALFGLQIDGPLALGGGAALLIAGLILGLRHGRACAVRPAARWRQPALILISFALAYGLLGLLAPWAAARQEDATSALVAPPLAMTSQPRRATLAVEKMTCPPCAASVRGLLKRKSFVRSFVAEEGNETVVIDYDSRQVDAHQLVQLFPLSFKIILLSDAPLP